MILDKPILKGMADFINNYLEKIMDWICPKQYPPKNGDILFGLTIDDYDLDKEPFVQRYMVVDEPEPNPYNRFSYFLVDKKNNIIDDEETESILTQEYSVILYKIIKLGKNN
jgi:hypothetical protein